MTHVPALDRMLAQVHAFALARRQEWRTETRRLIASAVDHCAAHGFDSAAGVLVNVSRQAQTCATCNELDAHDSIVESMRGACEALDDVLDAFYYGNVNEMRAAWECDGCDSLTDGFGEDAAAQFHRQVPLFAEYVSRYGLSD